MVTIRRIQIGEGELYRRVRLASLQDAPYAFGSKYSDALKRSRRSWAKQADSSASGSDRATFLALSDGDPVGIAAVYRDGQRVEEGELLQMWVAQELRGTGVGVELVEAALDWAAGAGMRKVVAGVTPGNQRVVSFYERCGFTRVAEDARILPGGALLARELYDL
jgi:RimJ/RimL family protein N-acetyltransferase